MADYSKFPALHHVMEKIPYPGASWNEVITSYPSFNHLHWSFLFAIASALLQIFCFVVTKLFAPILIGYTSTPNIKQSLWFHIDKDKQELFPKIRDADNQCPLYKSDNESKVIEAFNNYNQIANDALHCILQYQCKDEQS